MVCNIQVKMLGRAKRFTLNSFIAFYAMFAAYNSLNAATLPPGFSEQTVVTGLNAPVGLAFLPDGRMLTIQQGGVVQLAVNDVVQSPTFLDLTAEVRVGFEEGLLGIAVDPAYPARPYIYLYYTNQTPNLHYVARFTLTGALSDANSSNLGVDLSSKVVLINDIPNDAYNHNAGTLRFGPDGMLYISIGDDANSCSAQDRTTLNGVILRIKVDDSIIINSSMVADRASLAPADNPWVNAPSLNERLVWAYGLRNPYRFNIDAVTGGLIIGDVGSFVREELNFATGGENFGWPYWEGIVAGPNNTCGGQAAIFPIYDVAQGPARSIIGGPRYRSPAASASLHFPAEYEGVVFFTDFYEGFLRALRQNSSGTWDLVSPMNLPNGDFGSGLAGPSELVIGPDGALYYTALQLGEVRKIGFQAAPSVSGLWSASVEPSSAIFVFGENFIPAATQVTVNGIAAPLVQVISDEMLIFILPSGNTGGPVQVTTAQGSAVSSVDFGPLPTGLSISGVWPGNSTVGSFVFVFGSAFVPMNTQASINGLNIPITQVINESLLIFMVPNNATTGLITITTPTSSVMSTEVLTVL